MRIELVRLCLATSILSMGMLFATEVAHADDSQLASLSASEQSLVAICDELQDAFNRYHEAAAKIEDEEERHRYYKTHDPSASFLTQLLEFEKSHHRIHVGLMALRRIIRLAAGNSELDSPVDRARREALKILPAYADNEVLPELIRYLNSGTLEPESEDCLRTLMETATAGEQNQEFARYMLARWALDARDARVSWERRLKELDEGDEPRFPEERDYIAEQLSAAHSPEQIDSLQRESIAILESLANSNLTVRQPGIAGVDEKWHIIRIDREKTNSMPLVKSLAAGLLFQERHLQLGRPAPDLDLKLFSGERWSLADERGKAVVIQFSFKGCGPCEAMYPDLRELAKDYDGRLTILSIMADVKQSDTADAVSSGKLTWHVYWDGDRGPVATKWAVQGFPAVYVVAPDGSIAAQHLRGARLRKKIDELIH